MKYITFILAAIISGCNINADIASKKVDKFECLEETAANRATFIKTCVVDLKESVIKCEDLSERLFCSEHKVKNDVSKPN